MNLTKKNSLHLYHYCTSIQDALRPYLNTPETPVTNNLYWIDSLTRFKKVLNDILGDDDKELSKIFSSILSGLLSNPEFTKSTNDISKTINIAYESSLAVTTDLKSKYGE